MAPVVFPSVVAPWRNSQMRLVYRLEPAFEILGL
jgi:hypothetical protein